MLITLSRYVDYQDGCAYGDKYLTPAHFLVIQQMKYATCGVATQTPVTSWGLDRIDQSSLPLSNSFSYGEVGSNVYIYIIDTGIRKTHSELAGRVSADFFVDSGIGTTADDLNGGSPMIGYNASLGDR